MRFKILWKVALILVSLCLSNIGFAEVFTGRAYIENDNLLRAREEARRDALRSFVEEKVGVRVNSKSETENFLLVRDHITAKSEGYVIVKKIVSEKVDGEYLVLALDLEVGTKPFELAENEVKLHLQTLDRNSSRGSLDIAITDDNSNSTWDWSRYMVAALRKQGFARIKNNDAILLYLSNNMTADKLQLYSAVRKLGRDNGSTAKAILRGSVKTINSGIPVGGSCYKATAQVSLEIIGYESDNIDAISRYATALGETKELAEIRAKEKSIEEAAAGLAQQASLTVQYEEQGGRREFEVSLVFPDAYNKQEDSKLVAQALEASECEIDRSTFAADGSLRVAIYSQAYEKLNDLVDRVMQELRVSYPNVYREENSLAGDAKIIIRLR